jgi:hypothetical protein
MGITCTSVPRVLVMMRVCSQHCNAQDIAGNAPPAAASASRRQAYRRAGSSRYRCVYEPCVCVRTTRIQILEGDPHNLNRTERYFSFIVKVGMD